MTKPFSLSKNERLKSKKNIDTLFLTGKAFFIFPFKVIYKIVEASPSDEPLVFGISVPKRIFKRANKRNTLKRLTRECYRIHKVALKQTLKKQQQCMHVMFVYTHSELLAHKEMLPKVIEILEKLLNQSEKISRT